MSDVEKIVDFGIPGIAVARCIDVQFTQRTLVARSVLPLTAVDKNQ